MSDKSLDSQLQLSVTAYISDWECNFVISDLINDMGRRHIQESQLCAVGDDYLVREPRINPLLNEGFEQVAIILTSAFMNQAETGNPLVTRDSNTLTGVLSYKVNGPNGDPYPHVYTEVSHFLPWIGFKLATETASLKVLQANTTN